MDKFYPRSFNMGIRKSSYEALGGFSPMRFGEDIDFSIRLFKNGNKVCLFPSAWVYHKRRTDWHKFFRQVYNSGIARINLYKKYPDSLKLVHLLPAAFTLGVLFSWSEASSALGVYCRSDFSVCLSLRILRFRIKASKSASCRLSPPLSNCQDTVVDF